MKLTIETNEHEGERVISDVLATLAERRGAIRMACALWEADGILRNIAKHMDVSDDVDRAIGECRTTLQTAMASEQ